MDLVIKQSISQQEPVTTELVDVLYHLTKPDPTTGQPASNAVLVGRLSVPAAYEDAVNFLNTQFSSAQDNGSDFQVTVLNNNYYIRFADPEVVRVLTAKGIIPEGGGLTTAQAAQISIGQATGPNKAIFYQNTTIETFDEFKYFTRWNRRQTDIYGMFQGCTSLISVDLTNVVSLAYNFCNGCTSLIHFHGIDSEEGVIELNELITPNDNPHSPFSGCTGLKVVKSLGNLTKMLASLFQNCNNLTTVYQSVLDTFTQCTRINTTYSAFNGCSKLENFVQHDGTVTSALSLPNLAGTLGESSFKGCAKITSIASLGSIDSIGNSAFENCTSLATINFPTSITSVGANAFNNTAWYNSQPNGEVVIGSCLYKYKGTLTGSYSVPNSITYITASAYADTGITSLTIPDTVTYIGNEAFVRCSHLASVNLGNGVVTLDGNVFVNCTSLTSVTLPDSLVNLNGQPFRGCTALSSVTVSSNNTAYDSRDNCNAVIKSSTNELVLGCKDTTIPNSVTSIGVSAFHGCSGLTSVTIPESVTSIGGSAFVGCSGLTSINIPNSVTRIDRDALSRNGLTNVVIGTGITFLGRQVFYNNALQTLTIKATVPPHCYHADTLASIPNTCIIYVPSESVDAYKTANIWKDHASQIQAIPT